MRREQGAWGKKLKGAGSQGALTPLLPPWPAYVQGPASDEDLGDAMNEVMTEILTKSFHHDICSPAMYVDDLTEGKPYCYRTHSDEM